MEITLRDVVRHGLRYVCAVSKFRRRSAAAVAVYLWRRISSRSRSTGGAHESAVSQTTTLRIE
jgi:hypothetical protein